MNDSTAAPKREAYRRRNYIVNPRFQLTVSGFFILLAGMNIWVLYMAFRSMVQNFRAQTLQVDEVARGILSSFVNQQEKYMENVFILVSVVVLIYMLLGGIFISHHIAGPVFALRKNMRAVIEKDEVNDLFFRRQDFFHEVLADYNELLQKIKFWRTQKP
jgi:hypothetical protein